MIYDPPIYRCEQVCHKCHDAPGQHSTQLKPIFAWIEQSQKSTHPGPCQPLAGLIIQSSLSLPALLEPTPASSAFQQALFLSTWALPMFSSASALLDAPIFPHTSTCICICYPYSLPPLLLEKCTWHGDHLSSSLPPCHGPERSLVRQVMATMGCDWCLYIHHP
ncbi:hypothetical protein BDN71DRAFT_92446 [Pleurotus eryngii]|uniref:Uncharacterized protein n=1 Tax=Pleurotus eryngii TaxID=5323 RepID=A0A9P5ZQF4_PLEER|nr:hypothetical protein BDN71DRAFT_92446 [Pleurotus eryngii]